MGFPSGTLRAKRNLRRLSAEREALDVVRGEAEAARREAVEMADSLAVELENAQAALSAQAGELERAKAENGRLTAEIAAVKESGREAVEYARRQAEQAQVDAAKARDEAAELRGRLVAETAKEPRKAKPKT